LRFVPDGNENGTPYATVGFQVSDGSAFSAVSYTLTVNVTAVNDAPTSSNDSVTTAEDTTKILALSDFGTYSDVEATPLAAVKITTLETDGSLEWFNGTSWVGVALNQVISAGDINLGRLRFVPDGNENGAPYATIGFQVGDGTDFSASSYTLTVNVTPVDDTSAAPIGLTLTVDKQPGNSLPNGEFGFFSVVDPDGGGPYTFLVTSFLETELDGTPTGDTSDDITVSSSGVVSATPGAGDGRVYQFTVKVSDASGSYSEAFTIITGTNSDESLPPGTTNVGDDVIFGRGDEDTIFAGSGDDTVFGQSGDDDIYGGTGNDTLWGGANHDDFVFDTALNATTNVDIIKDFDAGLEHIWLDNDIFTAFGSSTGNLSSNNFKANAGAVAGDNNDFILYDTTTGNLYYDADGNLNGFTKVLFAKIDLVGLSGTVDSADFQLIA
jgi:Ca2+-binding RTX toxin-like protein